MHASTLTPGLLRTLERTYTAAIQNAEGRIILSGPLTLPAARAVAQAMADHHGRDALLSNRTTPVLRISPHLLNLPHVEASPEAS